MSEITFKGIKEIEIADFKVVFEYLAKSKADCTFDELKLKEVMGDKVTSHFVNPTKEEADEMLARWNQNPNIEMRWDFGSWFDALDSAEIEYENIEIDANGRGRLVFKQLAWPSGGIDATVELVKAFGGEVVANNAI